MEHFISRHAWELVAAEGYAEAVRSGAIRLLVADSDGYDAVLTAEEIAELEAGLAAEDDPTAIWQPDMRRWDPPASYRSPPAPWGE